MTFDDLAAVWRRCGTQEKRRLALAEPRRILFQCCQGAVQRRAPADGLPDVESLLPGIDPRQAAVARAHLECVRLAAARQWTSDTVESSALRQLHARLFPAPPAHLPHAFLRDLAEELLGHRRQPEPRDRRVVLFPLVWQEPGRPPTGTLVQFVLERLDVGEGQVFLDPVQAFVSLDDSFSTVFRHAADALRQHGACPPRGDVRVRIEHLDPPQVWAEPLIGKSGGGALALGLWALWAGAPLQAGLAPSFALTPPDADQPDGNCHHVGGLITKASEIAEKKPGHGLFLVAKEQLDDLKIRAEVMHLKVEGATDLRQAFEIGSGRLAELLAYLDALAAEANRVPAYYPRDARMERVRVRVRVSAERVPFDPTAAAEREQARRQGMADDTDAVGVYRHRLGPDGTEAEQEEKPKVEVLDWDKQVRDKVRRGVVVGDPGLGKTWLLKWEAARYASEAARRLRDTGDLAGGVLPICIRQTDVAAALHTLQTRAAHGTADVPTLPEAVVWALRDRQLPAGATGPSRMLSPHVLDLLRSRLGTEHSLLLLDAYDEVPADRRPLLRQALGAWVPHNPQARTLFTSRVVGYEPPWPIAERSETEREMELLPFDDTQMGAFVEAFFAGEPPAARELSDLLRRAPQARGMAQIPLLLGFLCALHREERLKPERQRHDVARMRRTDLYKAVLERLLSGKWKEPPRSPAKAAVDAKLELLEPVAFRLFAAGKEQFSLRELRRAVRAAHATLYPGQPPGREELTEQIREWSEEDGVLVEAGAGGDPPYLFLHLTFQEYLAARHLAQRINGAGWEKATLPVDGGESGIPLKELIDRKAWLPAWQELIVLLAGNLDDPVPLLKMLGDESKGDIFRHRLALAALCLPEVKELQEVD
jgi:hypothetical protein